MVITSVAKDKWLTSLLVGVALLALWGCGSDTSHARVVSAQTPAAFLGTWGGEGIQMTVGLEGAVILYNCVDDGTIIAAIVPDAAGHFQVEGTLASSPAFPVLGNNQPRAALYAGTIAIDSMELSVTVMDTGLSAGSFILTHGVAGHVFRCG